MCHENTSKPNLHNKLAQNKIQYAAERWGI